MNSRRVLQLLKNVSRKSIRMFFAVCRLHVQQENNLALTNEIKNEAQA